MGKKPVRATPKSAGYKKEEPAAAAPAAESAEDVAAAAERRRIFTQRRDASKWVDTQLALVRSLLEKAKERKNSDWLQVATEFHEVRLIKAAKNLTDKEIDGVPQELKEGVEAYVAQCTGNADIQEDGFKFFQEVWNVMEAASNAYVRKPETPEAEAAIEKLKSWTDASVEGVAQLVAAMQAQMASPGAQQAGLTRIGFLFSEAREGTKAEGLLAAGLMPCIKDAMTTHLADPDVQRYGCAALRGVAMADGQLGFLCDANGVELAVEGLRAHYKITDVCAAANGAFWAMAQVAGKNSPEVTRMRTAGVTDILLKVMTHHAWDQTLCGRVRVTLPFLTED